VIVTPFAESGARGSFTLSGAIADSGAVRTRSADGSVGRLTRTLIGRRGAIRLDLTSTAVGDLFTSYRWRVVGGTAAYEPLRGSGAGSDRIGSDGRIHGLFFGTVHFRR
jgi:hypothetical protein